MLKSASKVTINTGNVLNLIDIKKKAGQNVTEEVSTIIIHKTVLNTILGVDIPGWLTSVIFNNE